jgi:hypothetical protein
MMTETQKTTAVLAIAKAIIETIQAGGPMGTPGGMLYAALMTYGCDLRQFEGIMSGLVSANLVEKRGNLYFAGVRR